MATDRRLRADLLARLGVTPQRLSQRVGEMKRKHGPMSTEEATYVIAHMEGLDLSKYLDRETRDHVRGMVPRGTPPAAPTPKAARAAARARHVTRPVAVTATVAEVDLLLSPQVGQAANEMASLYPKLYLLENSIRAVISRVMVEKHGVDWWDTCATADVKNRVRGRKEKEARAPWHGRRGAHDIYYSDFSDLKNILVHNWADFQHIFPNQGWITVRLEDLEPARNTLAHHNPVPKKETSRLDVYFDDWAKLIGAKKDLIP